MEWTSSRIRQTFLEFFEKKGHKVVPSAPMVIKDDPTLMFTNAGMNQFKDIFLGNTEPTSQRVTDTQKCLRVSGKQNDLEEVGLDTYHHTMFEMLGNWSFGDYFKKESISWAWELLTEVFALDKDRLYVTVFSGDAEDKLEADEEAASIWKQYMPADRVLYCGKKDNYWEMGETGPSGPCSEIHVDLRSEEERAKVDGKELVNEDHPQVIEVWNLVFIQYNRKSDRSLEPLPKRHIDTGMGFERLAMVLQGKTSNYDTDVFSGLIQEVEKISGQKYGAGDEQKDVAIRVIVDHLRAVSFSIADGQMPSNTGPGYVIRRILRRAIRYAYSFLEVRDPFIYKLVPMLVEQMGDRFPELPAQRELILRVIEEEENGFLSNLQKGIHRIEELLRNTSYKVISGKKLFDLYQTYGFPIDLTSLILRENNREADLEGFQKELEKAQEQSRDDSKFEMGDWVTVRSGMDVDFRGYDKVNERVRMLRYRKVEQKGKIVYQMVFNKTPFYPEGGGQIGDTGKLFVQSDPTNPDSPAVGEPVIITNTKRENNLIVHFTKEMPEDPSAVFLAQVDERKRRLTENNHTATHLLHQALREVLGTHVEQKGSYVGPGHLRFDFSHFSKVTPEEMATIEQKVNQRIRQDLPLDEHREMPMDKAMEMGAMALFGEKYGETVRVIRFGDSTELCGGTHVPATGKIGLFKITSESASSAGIRRIEAITADGAEEFVNGKIAELEDSRALLKNPKDLAKAISDLLAQNSSLQKELEKVNRAKAGSLKSDLLASAEEVNGVSFIARQVELDGKAVKDLAFQLKAEKDNLVLVLGTENNGKAQLAVMVSENLVDDRGLHAGNMVKELAREIQGGGGGQPFFATAGGKNPAGIPNALANARKLIDG